MNNMLFYWKEGNYSNNEVLWEHDTMNIYDAKRISNSFQPSVINEFNIDCWQLGFPEAVARTKIPDLQSVINVSKDAGIRQLGNSFKIFLQEYISKKLS